MIAIIIKGRSFRGIVNYTLQATDNAGRERPEVTILSATVPGRTAEEFVQSFGVLRRKRPNLGVAVAHIVLSFRPDAPPVSDATATKVAETLMQRLRYDGFLLVRHSGHVHCIASRITFAGGVVSDAHDYRRAETIVRDLEHEFGIAPDRRSHLVGAR
ncbi:hypothetical protein JRF84_31690 [Methylobacterium organophilum]|jgi:hypothetical protein|uniref:relaxase/mobilization nuclease domain-containing protein n=1 Tax=Methylobacterium organophilum TaxID=410 RepID=UPI0019D10940|nr:hypothetical protein [Methylobacterium organophilum]MBN6824131.1 hypothetical protein [Methylobacterium organophilum]